MAELWVEKYRPKALDDYVWRDPGVRQKAEEWIVDGALPHLLFAGSPGTGKTSLALMLLGLLNVPLCDIMVIKASKVRKVDELGERIDEFMGTYAMGDTGIKYIVLDEMDAISLQAQKMLRNDMEDYSDRTRLIGTANYLGKIIPALQSRFHVMPFAALDRDAFLERLGGILIAEEFDLQTDTLEILQEYVAVCYPDLRKAINLVQNNITGGVLVPPRVGEARAADYLLDAFGMFKAGRFREARTLIVEQAQPEEYPDLFRWLYRNLNLFGATEDQQDRALLKIRDAAVNHTICADPEINLSATLVELIHIGQEA